MKNINASTMVDSRHNNHHNNHTKVIHKTVVTQPVYASTNNRNATSSFRITKGVLSPQKAKHLGSINGSMIVNTSLDSNSGYHSSPEVNGNNWRNVDDDKFEIPLPFGYHMDLDFLRFTSEDLVSTETLDRLRDLRRQRRKQRKTLEALMGIKQEQREREMRQRQHNLNNSRGRGRGRNPNVRFQPPRSSSLGGSQTPDPTNAPEFIKDALKDAVQDFELHLERTKENDHLIGGSNQNQSVELLDLGRGRKISTKTSKFNTFPRSLSSPEEQNNVTSTYKMFRNSNSSLSSISTSSSAFLNYPPTSPDAVLAGLPSSVPPKMDPIETDSITSITSEMSTHTLKNIREQMARSLAKLKEYEKQVEAIPVMQAKFAVMKEEKRLLMLQLKQREMELRREKGEAFEDSEITTGLEYDTEDEDFDGDRYGKFSGGFKGRLHELTSRARSESPYARGGTVHPEEFLSVQKRIRSSSCGYNSDSDLIAPMAERRFFESERNSSHRLNNARLSKSSPYHNLSTPHLERSEVHLYPSPVKPVSRSGFHHEHQTSTPKKVVKTRDSSVNTDPMKEPEPVVIVKEKTPPPTPPPVRRRDRAINTDPPPKSPPPPRKINHGTNTLNNRTIAKGVGTLLQMDSLITKQELEARVQAAIFKTEEEIMGCPLLQKAMARVEEEALYGEKKPEPEKPKVQSFDAICQVGDENLRPFVISVGLQCKLDETRPIVIESQDASEHDHQRRQRRSQTVDLDTEKVVRSIGVGECKVIEDPKEPQRFREIGICTEKWVEVIKASKQTDTEDFAFKDTESPRVADMILEPSPERVVWEKRSSLRRTSASSPITSRRSSLASPVPSRKSSALSTTSTIKVITKSQATMTNAEAKTRTRDAMTNPPAPIPTKSVGTSALMLPLTKSGLPAGSPLSTPETEKPPVNMSLCDKCNKDIHKVAEGVLAGPPSPRIAPPSPDMPWVSKIPRPVPENPDVFKLKSALSIGNLSIENRSKSPVPGLGQRSKSSLTPSTARRGSNPKSPVPRNALGTPPPHPSTPPIGGRRVASPLARSQSPYAPSPVMSQSLDMGKRSLIPKFSPVVARKQVPSSLSIKKSSLSNNSSSMTSPSAEKAGISKSLIPRVVTPPALRKMYPKPSDGGDKLATPDRQVVRKNTFTKLSVGVANPDLEKEEKKPASKLERMKKRFSDIKEKLSGSESDSDTEKKETVVSKVDNKTPSSTKGGFPLPGAALFAPIDENRTKVAPSKEMKAALKVLNDSLGKSARGNAQVTNAVNIVQQEWFKVSSTKQSNPLDVEDYLDAIEDISKELLDRVVNLTDVNGNTALHYSVSHGNFDIVSVLLDSKVSNPNIMNKAGYTCIMLISLAAISNETNRSVVGRLFSLGDVNVRATQHGQTALMLAVSHGRTEMVELLVEAGADINVRDEDGSTALMCAAEHGHGEIVKFFLGQPDTNVLAKDNDGLTALAVAMEAGHRDIGVILYANMSFSRGASPYSSMRIKKGLGSRTATPTGGKATPPKSPIVPSPPLRTRRNSSNQ